MPVWYPTIDEIQTCEWIELTSSEEWDPKSSFQADQEQICQDQNSQSVHNKDREICSSSIIMVSNFEPQELS